MSVRESIAGNIVTVLSAVTSPVTIKYVTREPFDFSRLSNAQYPAVLVRSAGEDRTDDTVGGSILNRLATINYELICYVKDAGYIDTARNNLIEAVEEGLDADRGRGGNAIDTQITSIEIDEGSIDPVGGVIITVQVLYEYVRGTT